MELLRTDLKQRYQYCATQKGPNSHSDQEKTVSFFQAKKQDLSQQTKKK